LGIKALPEIIFFKYDGNQEKDTFCSVFGFCLTEIEHSQPQERCSSKFGTGGTLGRPLPFPSRLFPYPIPLSAGFKGELCGKGKRSRTGKAGPGKRKEG